MNDIDVLFNIIPSSKAPAGLEQEITYCIRNLEVQKIHRRKLISSGLGLGSLLTGIPLSISLFHTLSQTGFYQYTSLILSGESLIYWKELSAAVIESLPLFAVSILLTVITTFFWSLSSLRKNQGITQQLASYTS